MIKHLGFVLMILVLFASKANAGIIDVSVQGTFGGYFEAASNLPEDTYPFPNLMNGGSFQGIFSYENNAKVTDDGRYPYLNFSFLIMDKFGVDLYTINTGWHKMFIGNDRVFFNFGIIDGESGVPNDLRLTFDGPFSIRRPSLLDGLTFDPSSSLLEIDGAVPGTYWDIYVASANISLVRATNVPEPSTMLLFGSGLAGLGLLRKRFKS